MSQLVTFGETMALLSTPRVGPLRHAAQLNLGAAGSESNVAIGFQRLGGAATWIGRVGADELGAMVATTIRGTGVRTVAVVDPDRPTGLMFKERRSAELSRVQYYRDGSAGSRLCEEDLDGHIRDGVSVVHISGITTALSPTARAATLAAARRAREVGAAVSVDINYRAALWTPQEAAPALTELVALADVVFATVPEARLVVGDEEPETLAARLAELGPRQVLIKLGDDGCLAWTEGSLLRVPAVPVPVVDSVGAGDAFAAGYLFELARRQPVTRRLETATRTGAYAVTVDGDWEGAPSYDELGHLGEVNGTVLR
ncbi:sugar kinase [Nocardioides sp. BYT-33-1]|uniref:sugar kinase n=1 Tax=Nocardioides sp. BYT-33-1 TaxID=3416952 RepID=UPI003F5377AE